MKIRLLALVALLLLPASSRAEDVTAAEVLKKAIEAHGGADALNKLKASAVKASGSIFIEGNEVQMTADVVSEMPDKYKMKLVMEVNEQKVVLENIVNGEKVKSTLNENPNKLTESLKAELRQAAFLQEATQLTPLLDDKKFKVKKEDDEDVEKSPAFVLTVSSKELKETKLFFDKKSGLLVKSSRKGLGEAGAAGAPKEVAEETVLTDYKKVDGIMMPMKILTTHDGKKFMILKISEAKASEKAEAKSFEIEE